MQKKNVLVWLHNSYFIKKDRTTIILSTPLITNRTCTVRYGSVPSQLEISRDFVGEGALQLTAAPISEHNDLTSAKWTL